MNTPPVPLVRASAVLPFIRFLDEAGAPVERYLVAANLPPCIVERPEDLLSLHQALTFVDRAAAGERVERLGFLTGERTEIAQLGAMGRIIQRSMTLWCALTTVAETINLYSSGDRIWLVQDNNAVLFCHAFVFPNAPGARHGNLYTIMLMIKLIRLAMGKSWWPREIRMPKVEMAHRKFYGAHFPTDVVFHDSEVYAIVVERPLFALAMADTERPHARLLDDTAFLRSTAPAPDLGGSVRQAIGPLLPSGYPDIRLVANIAGLSVRTLQRRLDKDGRSYARLVDQVRFETAMRLLRDDRVKLIDIAFELGYSDPANFTRAFRRWTGVSPSAYRRLANTGMNPPNSR